MENYFKDNMNVELKSVIRDRINSIFDDSLNLKKLVWHYLIYLI